MAIYSNILTRPMREDDVVNKPPHYNKGSIECINAIEASMSKEEFAGYLKGNVVKYLWRYKDKGKPKEDLDKSNWYLERLRGLYE